MSPRRTSTWNRSSNAWRSRSAPSKVSRRAPMASVKTWSSIVGRLPVDRWGAGLRGQEGGGDRDVEVPVAERGDAPAGLHRVLGGAQTGAEEGGRGIQVGHGVGQAEEAGGSVAGRFL